MTVPVINQKIRANFSEAAPEYDGLTELHKRIGRGLIGRIRSAQGFLTLLDVGMGTGWFTRELTAIFPNAMVVGLDFAAGMVFCAHKRQATFKIVEADAACLPFKEEAFDIITSNLAYQWIEDLSRAFALCRSCLRKEGGLYLTMFGHDTFKELFEAFNVCVGKENNRSNFTIQRLANQEQVEDALKRAGFNTVFVMKEHMKVHFSGMMNLIKWIKDIGANALSKDVYMGKELLFKADQYYNQHFNDPLGVYATLEVIWVEAR